MSGKLLGSSIIDGQCSSCGESSLCGFLDRACPVWPWLTWSSTESWDLPVQRLLGKNLWFGIWFCFREYVDMMHRIIRYVLGKERCRLEFSTFTASRTSGRTALNSCALTRPTSNYRCSSIVTYFAARSKRTPSKELNRQISSLLTTSR